MVARLSTGGLIALAALVACSYVQAGGGHDQHGRDQHQAYAAPPYAQNQDYGRPPYGQGQGYGAPPAYAQEQGHGQPARHGGHDSGAPNGFAGGRASPSYDDVQAEVRRASKHGHKQEGKSRLGLGEHLNKLRHKVSSGDSQTGAQKPNGGSGRLQRILQDQRLEKVKQLAGPKLESMMQRVDRFKQDRRASKERPASPLGTSALGPSPASPATSPGRRFFGRANRQA